MCQEVLGKIPLCTKVCTLYTFYAMAFASFIRPYKHYESSVIQDVVDGKSIDTCVADDSTIRRWQAEHRQTTPHIETLLRSVQKNAYPLLGPSLLTYLRQTKRHWASFVTPLLCAASFFPCTQFACCPSS